MAENKDGTEKSEEPTGKRIEDSRKKGQIARSKDLNTFVMLMLAAGAFLTIGGQMLTEIMAGMARGLQPARYFFYDKDAMMGLFVELFMNGIWLLIPFLTIMMISAVGSSILLGGWSFSVEALGFKINKLNPMKGLGRMVSIKMVVELFKSIAKFVLVMSVASILLWTQMDTFLGLAEEPVNQAIAHAGSTIAWFFLILSFTLIVVVAIDVPFQLYDHNKQLKMTLQEVKDEMKESEGRPEVKQHIRQKQQELSQSRMMQDIPDADVVVTNPTHFAVALKYDQDGGGAPIVVAKGADFIATQIRTVAQKHEVMIVSSPALARALYFSAEINDEIPEGLYQAIAQLLAYVYQLDAAAASSNKDKKLEDVPIPEEYRLDVDGKLETEIE